MTKFEMNQVVRDRSGNLYLITDLPDDKGSFYKYQALRDGATGRWRTDEAEEGLLEPVHYISYSEWIDVFKPVRDKEGAPRHFEAYGEDLEEVFEIARTRGAGTIWTDVDVEDPEDLATDPEVLKTLERESIEEDEAGLLTLYASGLHQVNRQAYFVTEVSLPGDAMLEVVDI